MLVINIHLLILTYFDGGFQNTKQIALIYLEKESPSLMKEEEPSCSVNVEYPILTFIL